MKTNGFNANFYTAPFKRIQFLILFLFPLILSAQPNYNLQKPVLISSTNNQVGTSYYFKTNYSLIKMLTGNPIMTMTKSNAGENQNLMLMKPTKPIQFHYEKTENPIIPNPMLMKTEKSNADETNEANSIPLRKNRKAFIL